jgi:hypothetical protein
MTAGNEKAIGAIRIARFHRVIRQSIPIQLGIPIRRIGIRTRIVIRRSAGADTDTRTSCLLPAGSREVQQRILPDSDGELSQRRVRRER